MSENLPATREIVGPATIESYAENLSEKLSFASILIKSGMLPQAYKTPEAVLTAILYGKELGFSPIRAVNSIDVIQGKPTLQAQALKALAIQHGGKIETIEWTDKKCSLRGVRGDWKEEVTFTWEDAALQELTSKPNWKKLPKAMLYARCVSILVRNMWADVLGGLYSTEEIKDSAPIDVTPRKESILEEAKKITVENDEMPDWDKKPKKVAAPKVSNGELLAMQNACDGEDILYISNHKITSSPTHNGKTVKELFEEHPEWCQKALGPSRGKLNEIDALAMEAYNELYPIEL